MTIPGGAGTIPYSYNFLRARRTSFYHGSELPRCRAPTLHFAPPQTPAKVATWRTYLSPPRYYNLFNRQAGRPLNLPPPKSSPAFLLCAPRSDPLREL